MKFDLIRHPLDLIMLLTLFLTMWVMPVGCTSAKPAIIGAEHSLHIAADLFQETAAIMDKAQESGAVSVGQYRDWRTFGEKFKVSYPLALSALDIAIATESTADVKTIHETIGNLIAELGRWYVSASIAFSTKPDGGLP